MNFHNIKLVSGPGFSQPTCVWLVRRHPSERVEESTGTRRSLPTESRRLCRYHKHLLEQTLAQSGVLTKTYFLPFAKETAFSHIAEV